MKENTFPTGKPHVSFSEIKIWKECPWRHKLTYIDKIDMFADAPGKLTCKSSLSNSKGPLCLTDEHKKLLTTRGGNMSGDNAEYSQ